MKQLIMVICAILVACSQAFAQRTVPGDGALTIVPVYTGTSFGGHAGWTQWTLWGGWDAGLAVRDYTAKATEKVRFNYTHIVLESDAMYRLLSTRSRSISLYGGGGAFIGVELTDPFSKLPDWISTDIGKAEFLYGIQAMLEADFYVMKRLSIGIRGAVPINFSSAHNWFHWETGLAFRYDF